MKRKKYSQRSNSSEVSHFENDSGNEEKQEANGREMPTKDQSKEEPAIDVSSGIIIPPKMVKRGRAEPHIFADSYGQVFYK